MNFFAADVSNLSDARYFAARGVNYMSFSLNPADADALNRAAAIAEWIEGPIIAVNAYQLDELAILKPGALIMSNAQSVPADLPCSLLRIYSCPYNEFDPGFASHWNIDLLWLQIDGEENASEIAKLCIEYSVYLEIHTDLENAKHIIADIQPAGIVLRGGEEERPGIKSFEELDEWFEAFEN